MLPFGLLLLVLQPALIQLIYTSLFEKILGVDLTDFTSQFQLPPDSSANFDFPELHDQSLPSAVINWVMSVEKKLSKCRHGLA